MAFKSVFDPKFVYRKAIATDIRKTFERVRREQQQQRLEKGADGKVVLKNDRGAAASL